MTRPGDIMILGGGRYGRYRIVRKSDLALLGGHVRWRDTVLQALDIVSYGALLWVNSQIAGRPVLESRLIGAAHLVVLGRFVPWPSLDGYDVGSEFEDGLWYRVMYTGRGDRCACTCPDFEASVERGGECSVRMDGDIVCKHILAVRVWRNFLEGKKGVRGGVADDRAGYEGDAEVDGRLLP